MDDQTFRDLKSATNDLYPDRLVLRDIPSLDTYCVAFERYTAGGDRRNLFESMIALGIDAHWIRWQGHHPHQPIPCIVNE